MTTDDELKRVAEDLARPAVHLRRALTPSADAPRSFFGGYPRLPPGTAWPRVQDMDGKSIAPTFIAQIQLDDLPAIAGRELLPARGTLAFFVDTDFEGNGEPGCAVIFAEGDASAMPELAPPDDLMLIGRTLDYSTYRWLEPHDKLARTDFRFAITPMVIQCYRPWGEIEGGDDWDVEKRYRELAFELQCQALKLAFAQVGEIETEAEASLDAAEHFKGWPHTAICIEHVARATASVLRKHMRTNASYGRPATPELAVFYERIAGEADAWAARAQSLSPAEKPDAAEASAFRDWYNTTFAAVHNAWFSPTGPDGKRVFHPGAMQSPELERTVEQALRFAARAVFVEPTDQDARAAALRGLQASESRTAADAPMHQMLGYGDPVQNAAVDHEDDVLLLQVSGEGGLAWHDNIGCVLQFWISPEDLAAGRFDAVVATLECD